MTITNEKQRKAASDAIVHIIEQYGGWSRIPQHELATIDEYQKALYDYSKNGTDIRQQ